MAEGTVCAKFIDRKKYLGNGEYFYVARAERGNRGLSQLMKDLTCYNKEFGYILVNGYYQ